MGYIRNLIHSKIHKDKSRLSDKDFTRDRKVGFVTLICMILNMIRKSTQLEIDDFMKRFGGNEFDHITYTKQSFSEARQKLNPKAFNVLNEAFVEKFYEGGEFSTYKGFRLLAIDGSCMEIPNTEALRNHYDYATNNNSPQKVAKYGARETSEKLKILKFTLFI